MALKNGSEFYTSVSNSLTNMYVQWSDIVLAEKVFKLMPGRDVVSWNTVIGEFTKSFDPRKALELFLTMPLHGVTQNQATFASVITYCSSLQILKYGELIHAKAIKINIHSDVIVGSALIDFYSKCNCLEEADALFTEFRAKNVILWNALIAGYSIKDSQGSFSLLQQMLREGYRPNEFSFSVVLRSPMTRNLQQLHCLILKMGYHEYDYISSCLISSYMDNGLLSHALSFAGDLMQPLSTVSSNIIAGIHNRMGQYIETQKLLYQVDEFDIVSWNTLITACTRSREYREALRLFKNMQWARVRHDNCTLVSLLSISTKLCNLDLGSNIHGLIFRTDFSRCDMFVCNVLVDMYSKCGSIEMSVKVFNEMTQRNLISWTALISGLGLHGYPSMALKMFREMELSGVKPDSQIGLLSLRCFQPVDMVGWLKECYNIEPEMDHYICLVDLLTRYGHLKEAHQLISKLPLQPNAVMWRIFAEGCRRYKTIEEAAR
ncbi:Pentatricopeptide repeat-containing protein [Thalictrum thalictroides]|uniref:Pentatricopeptide repeat-containing protein n=1 Tax=Thalictrum thalictroides TaxID=46969 RepID=A0A7J6V0Y1_THATH|nr:Pentatricopeptide repeat-containing protein [Thalictrum thalictroides]